MEQVQETKIKRKYKKRRKRRKDAGTKRAPIKVNADKIRDASAAVLSLFAEHCLNSAESRVVLAALDATIAVYSKGGVHE